MCKQSHSSYSCCAFLPCWALIHLTALEWPKAKYKGLQRAQEINFVNRKPLGWKWTLLPTFLRECIIRTESQSPPARSICPFQAKRLSSGVTRVAVAVWLCPRKAKDVLSLKGWSRQPAVPHSVCTQSQQPELPGSSLVNRNASEHQLHTWNHIVLLSPHSKPRLEWKPFLCQQRRIHKGPLSHLHIFLNKMGRDRMQGRRSGQLLTCKSI